MAVNKLRFLTFIIILMLSSCIKRYDPMIKSSDVRKYVVSGQVNRGDLVQRVNVSFSTSLVLQKYVPATGCIVKIIDGKGNVYPTNDILDGNYEAVIPENELLPGNTFMVDIQVPAGNHIVSDYDSLQDCPEVDAVNYELQLKPVVVPLIPVGGVQFYVDVDGKNSSCHRYRFEPVETWKYTANLYYLRWYGHEVCYLTMKVRNMFMLSTENQSDNKYKHFPLHFVDNYTSQRLRYGYSLLLRQYSLSEAAWKYYEKLKVNGGDQGGLYENQPEETTGNLHDLTHPEQKVLGFFGASTVKSKRIFVSAVITNSENFDCVPAVPPAKDNPDCLDCLSGVGGTTVKPAFWPW